MLRSTFGLRRKPLTAFVCLSLPAMLAASSGRAATCVVNSTTDDPADASAKVATVDPSGWQGANAAVITLRDCIVAANLMTGPTGVPTAPGMSIDTSAISGQTITLADNLPLLFNNMSIDTGIGAPPVTIDGGGAHRIFFVSGLPSIPGAGLPAPDGTQATTVNLVSLILKNGAAKGGNAYLGGAGMGAGGALFVNKAATVATLDVDFVGNTATGGSFVNGSNTNFGGGGGGASPKPRGGGGMGGSGGNPANNGGGGGGIGTDGTTSGGGFGGTCLGQISNAQNFGAGFGGGAYIVGGGTSAGGIGGGGGGGGNGFNSGGFGGAGGANQFNGGMGGFGGGGGGAYGSAGNGGFGGGGGRGGRTGITIFGSGGRGGFGGGGGGCVATCASAAGAGGVGGGAGVKSASSYGGGGAGFGGAVFVRAGGSLGLSSYAPHGYVSGGHAYAGIGYKNAAASASGFFLMSGASVLFNVASDSVYTIDDGVADDSKTSLPIGGSWTPGCTLGANDSSDPTNGGGPYPCGASMSKSGAGTLILNSAANTFAGKMSVVSGILGGTGTLAAALDLGATGVLAPGDAANHGGVGTLTVGVLTWNGGGGQTFQLGATNATADSDLIVANGALSKGTAGTFAFHFAQGRGIPLAGTTYTLIQSADASAFAAGDFSFDFDATYQSLAGTFAIVGNSVQFTITAVQSDRIFADGLE